MTVFGTLSCPLQSRYSPYLFLGDAVDPGVGDDHNSHRDVEADKGGGDSVGPVKAGVAVVRGQIARVCSIQLCVAGCLSFVPVELNRNEGDENRQGPCHTDHQTRHFRGHLAFIAEWARDGPVSVHTNHTQVQDRGSGAHDVKRHPDIAEGSKWPKPHNLCRRLPRHYQDSYQKVRDGQGDDKEVSDLRPQVSELGDSNTHKRVA